MSPPGGAWLFFLIFDTTYVGIGTRTPVVISLFFPQSDTTDWGDNVVFSNCKFTSTMAFYRYFECKVCLGVVC